MISVIWPAHICVRTTTTGYCRLIPITYKLNSTKAYLLDNFLGVGIRKYNILICIPKLFIFY